MAVPQCAMAQPGSLWATPANAFPAASSQNEWSRATARSNAGCTEAAQDVGKWTLPSFASARSGALLTVRASTTRTAKTLERAGSFMATFDSEWQPV